MNFVIIRSLCFLFFILCIFRYVTRVCNIACVMHVTVREQTTKPQGGKIPNQSEESDLLFIEFMCLCCCCCCFSCITPPPPHLLLPSHDFASHIFSEPQCVRAKSNFQSICPNKIINRISLTQ